MKDVFLTELVIRDVRNWFVCWVTPIFDQLVSWHISSVHDTVETLGSVTFTVSQVMFLLEMTYSQQSDIKVHKKIYTIMEELIDGVDNIPTMMDEVHKEKIQLFRSQEKSTQYQTFKTNLLSVSTPSIVSPSTVRDVIDNHVVFMCGNQGFSWQVWRLVTILILKVTECLSMLIFRALMRCKSSWSNPFRLSCVRLMTSWQKKQSCVSWWLGLNVRTERRIRSNVLANRWEKKK